MKNLYVGQDNYITFPLSKDGALEYRVLLTKITGDGVLDYQNSVDLNLTSVSHYSSAHYDPAHYDTSTFSSDSTLCFDFCKLSINIDQEELGGEYILRVVDQSDSDSLFYSCLCNVNSDLKLNDTGGTTNTIQQPSIYTYSKII